MEYSDAFIRQHEEMCQMVGSIVFMLAEAGLDSRRENIVSVLHSEIAEKGKWAPDQVLYLQLAIDLLEQARLLPGQGNGYSQGKTPECHERSKYCSTPYTAAAVTVFTESCGTSAFPCISATALMLSGLRSPCMILIATYFPGFRQPGKYVCCARCFLHRR